MYSVSWKQGIGKIIRSTDFRMCLPSAKRAIASVASDHRWRIVKIDAEKAFHQPGSAARKVYVIQRKESRCYNELWLLVVATYGFVKSNLKWQVKSGIALIEVGLQYVSTIPLIFFKFDDIRAVLLLVIRIVNDFLAYRHGDILRLLLSPVDDTFKLGSVRHGTGRFCFCGMSIEQHEDSLVTIDADDKLEANDIYRVTWVHRHQLDKPIKNIRQKTFMWVNASINWFCSTELLLCPYHAPHLQQKMPFRIVNSVIFQVNEICLLKRDGSISHLFLFATESIY